MEILRNFSLKKYNTFGIAAKAKAFAAIQSESDVQNFIANRGDERFYILGGGSNILFRGDFDGTVLHNQIKGIHLVEINSDYALVAAGAGETWDDFVNICTKNKHYGLENLALIPGQVGSAPVQNIGAYGVEQCDFFHSLEGYRISTGEKLHLTKAECQFGYRDSIFKNSLRGDFFITRVTYKLDKVWTPNRSYKELDTELKKFEFEFINQDADYVLQTVSRIRRQKLPDTSEFGNAGSFFQNPLVSAEIYEKLKADNPNCPAYAIDNGTYKIPAAWLIEGAGWKGKRIGDAGVYEKHALIIVNYGNASGEDIFSLSEQVIRSVHDKYGIELEREVNWVI